MIYHPNRGRLTVDPNGDWRLHAKILPPGATAHGTITRDDGTTGALIRTAVGLYAQLNGAVLRSLDGRSVAAAMGHAGRPSSVTEGRRVNAYLDPDSIEVAGRLGNGNTSEGIRIALKIAAGQINI